MSPSHRNGLNCCWCCNGRRGCLTGRSLCRDETRDESDRIATTISFQRSAIGPDRMRRMEGGAELALSLAMRRSIYRQRLRRGVGGAGGHAAALGIPSRFDSRCAAGSATSSSIHHHLCVAHLSIKQIQQPAHARAIVVPFALNHLLSRSDRPSVCLLRSAR